MFKCNKLQGLKTSQNSNVKGHNSNKTYHIKNSCKYNIYQFIISNYRISWNCTYTSCSRGAALNIYISAVIDKGVPITLQEEHISLK